jgi:prophage antirepressor-like protein
MNSTLQIFEHRDFGKVRTITLDGEPWFVAKDVTQALGYKNSTKAMKKHVDAEDRRVLQKSQNATFEIPTRGLAIINEAGLYCLALSSKLPQAKVFRRWVTSIVIPSIRKHGAYATPDTLAQMMGDPQFTEALVDALAEEHSKNVKLANQVAELSPRANYCEMVLFSGGAIPVSIIAKDYGMSAVAFNALLYDLGMPSWTGISSICTRRFPKSTAASFPPSTELFTPLCAACSPRPRS